MFTPGQQVTVTRLGKPPFKAEVIEMVDPLEARLRTEDGKRIRVGLHRIHAERSAPKLTPLPAQSMSVQRRITVQLGDGKPVPKGRPTRSKDYKKYVGAHACCGCGEPGPSDPHHFAMAGDGDKGTSLKPDDHRCVPLCRGCHDFWHDHHHLPGMSVADTNLFFLRTQVNLLVAWHERRDA